MEFRIASTFTDSVARLTGDEQRAAKTTAFDLQMDPSGAGHSFHKLDRAKDRNFWSVRVSRDIRLIVHRTTSSVLLAYVAHHDAAYRWAKRRRIERHPRTGAAQIVEIRETVREIEVPRTIVLEAPAIAWAVPKPALFADGRVGGWRGDCRVRWLFRRFRSGPQSVSLGPVSRPPLIKPDVRIARIRLSDEIMPSRSERPRFAA